MLKKEEKYLNKLSKHPNINGVGASIRPEHFQHYSKNTPDFIKWFELLADNFFHYEALEQSFPFIFNKPSVLHSVGLSIGSAEPLNKVYLEKIKKLDQQVHALHISDHLCWSSLNSQNSFDLLPLPYSKTSIDLVSDKIKEVEDVLSKPFLLENVSTYIKTPLDSMPEHEFINSILEQTNAGLLLDVNNVFVNSKNHDFDPYTFIDELDGDKVKQVHLAGHKDFGTYLIDNHGDFVSNEVWNLYKHCLKKMGNIPTCIEWDTNIPDFKTYVEESKKIEVLYE